MLFRSVANGLRSASTTRMLACGNLWRSNVAPSHSLFAPTRSLSTFDVKLQVFSGPKKPFEYKTMPLATSDLKPGEVLVRLDLASICGSDLHTISGMRTEPTPLVLGHEGVGTIIAFGPQEPSSGSGGKKQELSLGDRVTWSIADSCGHCTRCVDFALPQKCDSLFKYGHAALSNGSGFNGCYASHIILRAGTHLVRVPEHLPLSVIVPANCALVGDGLQRTGQVQPSSSRGFDLVRRHFVIGTLRCLNLRVVVLRRITISISISISISIVILLLVLFAASFFGAGLLGIYAVAWLKHELGFDKVWCVDSNQGRLEMAKAFGAEPLLARTDSSAAGREQESKARVAQVLREAPNGVDVVIEVAGTPDVVPEGVALLRFGGLYSLAGMVHPASSLAALTGEAVIRKCITLRGTHNYAPRDLEAGVAFVARNFPRLPFDRLVSPPLPLSRLSEAVHLAEQRAWPRVAVDCAN